MKRYEYYRLVPGTDPVEIQEKLWKTFRKLDDALDWFNHPTVFRAAEGGRSDFDLMAAVEIDDPARVAEYLNHPLAVKLADKIGEAVQEKAAFEHY